MSRESRCWERLTSRVVHLPADDVDTDQIIPAAFLKITDRSGLGRGLFAEWRKDPAFVLNRPMADGAEILLAGHNFGCGSSREHAAWALLDHGFRAVLSTGFSDIFRSNALKNGLLAARIEPTVAAELAARVAGEPDLEVTIDLQRTELVLPDGRREAFAVDAFARQCMLRGVDQLGYLEDRLPAIRAFEERHLGWVDTTRLGPRPLGGS